ncbi:MAG: bifunctional heptose 7-phosphate kinase/heptose 1-phosphate adenyltransferase [Phycisphaerae bacterium]|nr:bifunctional heptose 7-phosphate kinase/heptose 1-phosphate adenyltransferase [Phycisphaerae bacterium]
MSYTKLLKAVTNFGSPKVLLVGDFMLDSYVYGDALRISPEAPVQVLKVVKREYAGGGASSVAADITTLGAKCICAGVIGKDTNGQRLRKILLDTGADISGLLEVENHPTITKERIIGLAQHRHRQQLLRVDEECTDPLSEQDTRRLLDVYQNQLKACDIVCLQDYNKGILMPAFCQELISLAQQAGKKVLVDPPLDHDYAKFTGATLVTPNRKETSRAVGFEIQTVADANKASQILRDKLQLETVVITLDKEGAFLRTAAIAEHIPTLPRNVYDVTGAGDMMLAMLAVAIAAGCDEMTSLQLANIASGIEVEKFGVATVSVDEIVNEIISTHKGKTGKVLSNDELIRHLEYHHQQKETIVFTNGCFDVLHRGHIDYLKFCKEQGDIVVVGLNSDSSVRQLKGPERPINNQHDRGAVLAALESVDYICVFEEPDPLRLIEQVCPDVLVKGTDWKDKGVIGREFVESRGGRVELAPLVDGKSSTSTIEKMKNVNGNSEGK